MGKKGFESWLKYAKNELTLIEFSEKSCPFAIKTAAHKTTAALFVNLAIVFEILLIYLLLIINNQFIFFFKGN